ncbi:MAG TPA: hypothetical protein VMY87_02995 [Armatimonadota bacterium]|nr:hypothetical protein [Armatimonadota bacterium]
MSGEPTFAEIQTRIRELLGRATLLRARGEQQKALQLVQEAADLNEDSWEVHELVGDLYLDLGKGEQALDSYRRARELNPSRGLLEEKIGKAAIARAAREQTARMSEALLEGIARPLTPPRKPTMAALFSLVIPGLGQLYNGQALKGFVMAIFFVVFFGFTTMAILGEVRAASISPQGALYTPPIDPGAVLSGVFTGVNAVWALLLLGLYIYSIADAGLTASRSMTSDDTGLV